MNLLPKKEKDLIKTGLKSRFLVVSLFLLSISFIIGSVMLLPSYFLTTGYFSSSQNIALTETAESQKEAEDLLLIPQEIDAKLKFFQTNMKNKNVTSVFSDVISLLPQRVTLDSISFAKDNVYKEKKGSSIVISGIAETRESLVAFSKNLTESKKFSSVEVPVSSLARDKDLPFAINIFIEN